MKKGDGFNLVQEPAKLKSVSIGISKEDFLLAFNCDENNTPEYSCVIPAHRLKDIVGLLFSSGVEYENSTNNKIGFDIKE